MAGVGRPLSENWSSWERSLGPSPSKESVTCACNAFLLESRSQTLSWTDGATMPLSRAAPTQTGHVNRSNFAWHGAELVTAIQFYHVHPPNLHQKSWLQSMSSRTLRVMLRVACEGLCDQLLHYLPDHMLSTSLGPLTVRTVARASRPLPCSFGRRCHRCSLISGKGRHTERPA